MFDPYLAQNRSFSDRAGSPGGGRSTMLISGGSRGLGRELVRFFSSTYNVVFGFRDSEGDAEALFDQVTGSGNWCLPVRLDVSREIEVQRLREWVRKICGGLDVLIHSTGHFSLKSIGHLDPPTWRAEMDSTINSAFLLWNTFSDLLKSADRGRVVLIGDSAAEQLRARVQSTSYYVGKHGLVILARTIAKENQLSRLTCNVVSPGVLPNSIDLDEPGMAVNVQFEEVAGVVEFLLSPGGDCVSGSNIITSRGWNV